MEAFVCKKTYKHLVNIPYVADEKQKPIELFNYLPKVTGQVEWSQMLGLGAKANNKEKHH